MKEFHTVLLGQQLKMYTDHENITYKNFNTDRLLQWILILEEYGPNIEYILGKKNIAADVIARLPNNVNQNTTHETTYTTKTIRTLRHQIFSRWHVFLYFKLIDHYQR